ncbi:MAG TPA: 50S ribosomal protein L31 [Candidatus Andersenbacteria bacterium]|nr:50S ribosomal protein L31 [Candidatus Andersenbacteria bacterium]
MKPDIHPTYHEKVTISCVCGNSFESGSTADSLTVDVCSACHPFYTGKQKILDIAGRVDKFKKRQEEATLLKKKQSESKKKSAPKTSGQSEVIRISK